MRKPPSKHKPTDDQRTDNDRRIFGLLREIRGTTQYFQSASKDALSRVATMDTSVRSKSLAEALPAALWDRMNALVSAAFDAIHQLFAQDVREYEWCADVVAGIELQWEEIKDLWPAASLSFDVMQQQLTRAATCSDQIVYGCATLTLSPRVNDVLRNLRVGQVLDFEFEFGPELPQAPDLRKRLFLELAQEAGVIDNGVVDAARGVIYKAASSRWQQRMSAIRLLAVLVIVGAILPTALGWIGKGFHQHPVLNYLLIFMGSGAHLAVEAIKSAKAQTKPSFQAMNDWILWLHVRETEMFWGIAYVWLGYALLAFFVPDLTEYSAFLAGYSIDSVTEVFLARFEGTVTAATQALVTVPK